MYLSTVRLKLFSDVKSVRYSDSRFKELKNDSITELSYGVPGFEKLWTTPYDARCFWKVVDM